LLLLFVSVIYIIIMTILLCLLVALTTNFNTMCRAANKIVLIDNEEWQRRYVSDPIPVLPVNNEPLDTYPVPGIDNPQLPIIDKLKRVFVRKDGMVGDTFVPYEQSVLYVKSLPNATKSSTGKVQLEQFNDAENYSAEKDEATDVVKLYSQMRKRIIAKTIHN